MGESQKTMQASSANQVLVRVQLLDDDTFNHNVDKRAVAWILFDKVCEHLNILEKDYFGLNYYVSGEKFWLNNDEEIAMQLKDQNWEFKFEVKFYPTDPAQLVEDYTRYQLCLQIRRDIVNERLPCSFMTYTLLGAYTAQSELGDYDSEKFCCGYKYLMDIQFAPHQDKELLINIAELHRQHKGMTPEEAEIHFIENANKQAMYGVELHAAKDAEGIDIQIGVCASGFIVYKDKQQVNRFVWPKILKISYRRNKFYIKIRTREFEEIVIEFKLANEKFAKRLWKISVEHHAFFRLMDPRQQKNVTFLSRFGSRFRYSGRTQFQTRQDVSEENRESPFFNRVLSKRGTFSGQSAKMWKRDEVIADRSIVDFRRQIDKMDGALLEIDSVWRTIRSWGKFQMFQFFLILIDYIPACFAILSAVFTGYIPDYECKILQNEENVTAVHENFTYKASQCKYEMYSHSGNTSVFVEEKECKHFTYSNTLTYAYEWDLVCNRANLAALAQSLVLAGQGLGALIMCHIADRFGRKTVHVLSHIGVMASMIFMSFSTNIIMLLALRLVTGTFQQGIVCTGKILALEMFPREVRSHTEAATFIAWSVGIMILALYGYIFRGIDWRYLQIGLAAFSFYALFEWWMLDESVRWLISNGKVEQAKKILKKAARWNKVDYKTIENHPYLAEVEIEISKSVDTELDSIGNTDIDEAKSEKATGNRAVEKYNVIDILKNPKLRLNTIILWYSWIVATGTYYGLTLISTHLAGDRFVNFFLSGVIEIPSLLIEFYLFNKIGRKKTMILWFATAGIALIISTALLTIFKDNDTVATIATVFSLIGKSASTGCFSTVFLYTPELYPTNYRNSGLGIASSISRIGGILAPFASDLALIALWIPGAIFGGMCLLVAVFALRLPESASHELPTTIAECNKMDQGSASSFDDGSNEDGVGKSTVKANSS